MQQLNNLSECQSCVMCGAILNNMDDPCIVCGVIPSKLFKL